MFSTKSILRLSEDVVNRIAAGEVIQRPANAVKEMLENSLDAGSTNISIILKDGGLKYLQIQDNGSGIKKDDMDIVCERFTTSKLKKFEDLTTISTYGFRGEALASISHVAHVTILSKTNESLCAFKGNYSDGKLKEPLKPCAGNVGTQITVEDLFYNVPARRHILKSPSEEYQRVVDVVTKYALHNPKTGFLVKKQNDHNPDVKTQPNSSRIDNIRLLYGSSIAKEILTFAHEDKRLDFRMECCSTNANYSSKRRAFVLFINHRSVESSDLRKAIESVYAAYLPKGSYPFVYISLEISPQNVDVNVHPTKSEVHFLYESEIFDSVQRRLDDCLLGSNASRTYYTQAMLPLKIFHENPKLATTATTTMATTSADDSSTKLSKPSTTTTSSSLNTTSAHLTIRTDNKARKIDAFLVNNLNRGQIYYDNDGGCCGGVSGGGGIGGGGGGGGCGGVSGGGGVVSGGVVSGDGGGGGCRGVIGGGGGNDDGEMVAMETETAVKPSSLPTPPPSSSSSSSSSSLPPPLPSSSSSSSSTTKRRKLALASLKQLKREIESDAHAGLKEIIRNSSFVGCVDLEWCLVQHQTKLYLMNIYKMSMELFYQILIEDFGNFGVMKLSRPASIRELSLMALEDEDDENHRDKNPEISGRKDGGMDDINRDGLSGYVVDLLAAKAAMLWDYLSLRIDVENGDLLTLPLIMDNLTPDLSNLHTFVLRLATEVKWNSEKPCFKTLCKEISRFYAFKNETGISRKDPGLDNSSLGNSELVSESSDVRVNERKWAIEHTIYPALKSYFLPPKKFAEDGSLLQIANLPDLYKVFERC